MIPKTVANSMKQPLFEMGRLPFVSVERQENVALVTLDRPEKGNALNQATLFNLRRTIDWCLTEPEISGIVITGAQPGFVLGADLDFMIRKIHEDRFEDLHFYTDLGNSCFDRIASSPKPIVAVVNGSAMGGGVELALACHARLATSGASFSLPETGLGICPLWGAIPRLSHLIGPDLAKWVVYSGKQINAKEALSLGLVNEIFPAKEVMDIAIAAARNFSSVSPVRPISDPGFHSVAKFFQDKRIEDLFSGPIPPKEERLLFSSIRRLKQNSLLALQYSETIFEVKDRTPSELSTFYRNLVEHLYRSEDTILGLEWKKEGRITPPQFPSNCAMQ